MASFISENSAQVDTTSSIIIAAVQPGQPKRTKIVIQNQDVGRVEDGFQRTVRLGLSDTSSPISGYILPYLAVYWEEGEFCHQGDIYCASMTGTNVQVYAAQGN